MAKRRTASNAESVTIPGVSSITTSTPVAFSKRLNNPTGSGAEPQSANWSDETSASTGRCISAAAAVGTVTPDVARVVHEYKAGKVEFRNDSGGNVHAQVGKLSFDPAKLNDNIQAFISHIMSLKPAAVKGTYLRGISIAASMSPGVRVAA